jgi:putative ABC transport system permease protein
MAMVAFFVSILSGCYPAFFLSNLRPIQALRARATLHHFGHKPFRFRSGTVVIQFIISVFLIFGTIVIDGQLKYIKNRRLGFTKDHLLILPIRDAEVQQDFQAIKNRMLSMHDVSHVSAISNFPWEQGYYDFPIQAEGLHDNIDWVLSSLIVDEDFIKTMGMEVVNGRDFSRQFTTDIKEAYILNQSAVQKLGWEEAIGKKLEMEGLTVDGSRKGRVIGIVKDFHLRSPHHEIDPLVLLIAPTSYYLDYMAIRIDSGDIPVTIAAIQDVWNEVVPNRPFEYYFLDEEFNALYMKEQRLGDIFHYFSGLALCISSLGLFGLALFIAEQRTKEIGIRKVLGCSEFGIVILLSKDFLKLVLIASLMTWPLAWYSSHRWLQNFAYRIDVGISTFLFSGLLALMIALSTICYQSFRAARTNPVDVLKCE